MPSDARILSVGAGTGLEIAYLAEKFPGWRFVAVEPSGPMLAVCHRKMEESGVAARCEFHMGYLDSLPTTNPFDAATSLLVSQFVLNPTARTEFFRGTADRLRHGGLLVNADLAGDADSATYRSRLYVWIRVMNAPPEKAEALHSAYSQDVAVLPNENVRKIIRAPGFEPTVQFLETGLIHAWYAQVKPHGER